MAERVVAFYLPLRRAVAERFLHGETDAGTHAEQATLFAIALHRRRPMSIPMFERAIIEVQSLVLADAEASGEQLRAIWSDLDKVNTAELEDYLASYNIVFSSQLDEKTASPVERYDSSFQLASQEPPEAHEFTVSSAAENEYKDAEREGPGEDDEIDSSRSSTFSLTGSREQIVVARVITSAMDEHVEIDALAGTGKTHLILALQQQLKGAVTYVVPRAVHRHGAQLHASINAQGGVKTVLLFRLAMDAATARARELGVQPPSVGSSTLNPVARAAEAGIQAIGKLTAAQVLVLAERAINRWSHSDCPTILPGHFGHLTPYMPPAMQGMHVAAAEQLWRAMWSRKRVGQKFNVQLSHVVKWLALQDVDLPPRYGVLLVDEAHDLLPAWRRLLFRYRGGCILLGDPFQRLRDTVFRDQRAKRLAMTKSFRLGIVGDRTIRLALNQAPDRLNADPFTGSRDHITRVRHWRGRSEALQDGLRIYANEWALLEDAQRLKVAGSAFRLLPETVRTITRLVGDAHTLRHQREPGWMLLAGGYTTWEEFSEALEQQGSGNVVRLFERGYGENERQALIDAQAAEGTQKITLGLIEHVKNLEVSAVALNPCCFTTAQFRHGYIPVHAAYLGMSRVRDELWLPGDSLDRLADLQRSFDSAQKK